jgi:2-phospho-L-lactate/phosphoenolpyruvate guanylyltransferase
MSMIDPVDSPAAVVALKAGTPAKSRLASIGDALRQELAWAMAVDTLTALRAAVDQLLVVGAVRAGELTRLGLEVEVVPDPPEPGLNAALDHGAALLRERGFPAVLACVGDLPALTPASVGAVLAASRAHRRAFVADGSGIGTTMLIARGTALEPRFGGHSADAHRRSGAHALAPEQLPVPDARADVDTEVDLERARRIGVGRATREVLERAGGLRPTGS